MEPSVIMKLSPVVLFVTVLTTAFAAVAAESVFFKKDTLVVIGESVLYGVNDFGPPEENPALLFLTTQDALRKANEYFAANPTRLGTVPAKGEIGKSCAGMFSTEVFNTTPMAESKTPGVMLEVLCSVPLHEIQARLRITHTDSTLPFHWEKQAQYLADMESNILGLSSQGNITQRDIHQVAGMLEAYQWCNKGVLLFAKNDSATGEAIEALSMAISKDRSYLHAYLSRARVYRHMGRPVNALDDHASALKINNTSAYALRSRASLLLSLGRHSQALSDLSRILEIVPDDAAMFCERGLLHVKLTQPDKALYDFSRAIELDPRLTRAFDARGTLYRTHGKPQEAIEDFSRVIEIAPGSSSAFLQRGACHQAIKQFAKAIADFTKTIELDPDNADAYFARGFCHAVTGNKEAANEDYTNAIRCNPHLRDAYYFRGYNQAGTFGRHKEATEDFTRAILLDSTFTKAYQARGSALLALDKADKAIQDFSRVIRIESDNAAAYYNRGMAHRRLGDKPSTARDLNRYLTLTKGMDPMADKAKQMIWQCGEEPVF